MSSCAVVATSTLCVGIHPADAAATAYSMLANFPVPDTSDFLAIDPGTHTVYTSSRGEVTAINGTSHALIATTQVGTTPYQLAVDTASHDVYATVFNDGNITVLDGSTMHVKAVIPVLGAPYSIAVDPVTHTIYAGSLATSTAPATLTVINGSTQHVTKSLTLPAPPYSIGVDPATRKVYVALANTNDVLAVNGKTNTIATTIPMGTEPGRLTIDATAHSVYVGDYSAASIQVIDETTQTVTRTIPTSGVPQAVGLDPATHTAYVCLRNPPATQIIDTSTSSTVASVNLADCAFAVTDTSTHHAYATYFDAASVPGRYARMVEVGAGLNTSIVAMSARSGPASGGQTIILTGDHFTGTTRVTIGGTTATSFTVNSDSQITAVTPAHATGNATVQVRTRSAGKSLALPENRYRYASS